MSLIVRRATREDVRAISHLRVDTWRAAYAGLMSADLLDRLDADAEAVRRLARWDEMHVDPRGSELVAEVDGVVAGWAAVGASIDDDRPRDGQVFAIYARPEFWSRGVGHALMLVAEEHLRAAGFRKAHLWVLDGNERAAAFYERHGWREDGATMTDERRIGGGDVHALFERRRVRDLSERLPAP
ncbi:GNAT family N-acetyltransferase [Microbacterium sp. CFBP9034]|uniref:GNAT family N-acetyltransferase n=1 Tax=Microbacterium sp. CFBP9034 TaxID=3096540 RepID=UPI002A6A6371|nr:GNAT family N-acetyltransferase [Microbacterium sp. CFBP9034]MDY0910645.1 GNAT family N-acetyltransferase [Microbacterium sp. CFBP9034]